MKKAKMAIIPHLFRCPITLDLFKDPVTLSTGQTYERCSIEKWLNTGNFTCPVTMQKLYDLSIVPNHTLRRLIDQWLRFDHQCDQFNVVIVDEDHSLASLKYNLESKELCLSDKVQVLEKILNLCNEFPSTISSLIQLGFLPVLINLVFEQAQMTTPKFPREKMEFLEKGLSCVAKLLPFGELGCMNVLNEDHNFLSLITLFKQRNAKIITSLCQLIDAISASLDTQELCVQLGRNSELVHTMLNIILDPQNAHTAAESVIRSISSLSLSEPNQMNLVKHGVIDALIKCILREEKSDTRLAPMAMDALEILLGAGEAGKVALVSNENGVRAIVKMVFRVSDHEGSESALNSLMIIFSGSLKAREDGVCAGVLSQLLLVLQSNCNGRIKTKARMLLKLLRSMCIENKKHVV